MGKADSVSSLDATSRRILASVCADSRITTIDAAAKAGCSRVTAHAKLGKLAKALGLHYTVEFDQPAIGFKYRYIIAVKTEKRVDRKRFIELLKKSDIPQFAAICEGDFNLLIFAAAKSPNDYLRWSQFMRSSLQHGNKLVFWKVSDIVLDRLGFFPLRPEALTGVDLPAPQKTILIELVRNARVPLSELANTLKTSVSTAKYHFSHLAKKSHIRRFTAIMEKPITGLNAAILVEKPFLTDHAQRSLRVRHMYYFDDGKSVVNRYLVVSELSGHFDLFELANFGSVEDWHSEKGKTAELMGEGTAISSALIVDIVIGRMPARYVDVESIYDTASWLYES